MPKQLDNFMHSFFAESHIMSIIVQSKILLCCFGYESTHLWKSPENVASDWSIDQCHIWWRKRLRNFWAVSRLKLASKELGSIVKLTLTKCWADWWRFGSRNLDQLCYFHSDCSTNFGLASICSCRTAELSLTSCVKCEDSLTINYWNWNQSRYSDSQDMFQRRVSYNILRLLKSIVVPICPRCREGGRIEGFVGLEQAAGYSRFLRTIFHPCTSW